MENKWWEKSISEELTICALVVIAIASLWGLGVDAKDIILPIGGGLVGYLAKGEQK